MGNRRLSHPTERALCHILYVAYPLLPVSSESCGGAEQMLVALEAEMSARGHCTTVAACAGSCASGTVLVTGNESSEADRLAERNAEHEARIIGMLRQNGGSRPAFDLIHDKSGSFWRRECEVPVLATLHLPRHFYPAEAFESVPRNVYFNCVSHSQALTFGDLDSVMGVVRNGIRVGQFPFKLEKQDYLLWMGRVCEEKGAHIAIEVAQRTGLPLVLAGQVYPFSYHQNYYNERVRPYLGKSRVSFFETPTLETKTRLLANARALLVPSLVDETSSLVAMEAMACGTPVIGFRRGAIPEVIIDRVTGYVVENAEEMAEAVCQAGEINPHACRVHVESNYSAQRMAREYEKLYHVVLQFEVDGGPPRRLKQIPRYARNDKRRPPGSRAA
ncbi:MAG TPA: glycosyltransferase [Terriglobales bacterium]|nr:glycosyltransferase [Terriglobales bacterium]